MRLSIKDAIPEIFGAWEARSTASDAHLSGDFGVAADFLKRANCPVVWSWLNPAWVDVDKHVIELQPFGDTFSLPKHERDRDRSIRLAARREVLQRDGYRCRYCGIPVISADIRRFLARQYPESVPWEIYDPSKQHAGLSCMWLQFDHVIPHSHGGRSNPENVIVTCALCNFGKHGFTIRQLGLFDPCLRSPIESTWDGLERLRPAFIKQQAGLRKNRPGPT